MKYVATFDLNGLRLVESFDDENSAQTWLDSRNNNLEFRTSIDIYDDDGKFIDGYIYTEVP
jgi:hypothetical protein